MVVVVVVVVDLEYVGVSGFQQWWGYKTGTRAWDAQVCRDSRHSAVWDHFRNGDGLELVVVVVVVVVVDNPWMVVVDPR